MPNADLTHARTLVSRINLCGAACPSSVEEIPKLETVKMSTARSLASIGDGEFFAINEVVTLRLGHIPVAKVRSGILHTFFGSVVGPGVKCLLWE